MSKCICILSAKIMSEVFFFFVCGIQACRLRFNLLWIFSLFFDGSSVPSKN
jgi:hypothetical protein